MGTSKIPYTDEKIILVDPEDRILGQVEKIICHEFAMLHRAFSVFVFRKFNNNIEVLLQKRNQNKYHSGGLWTNTCCGHPHIGENLAYAAEKRLYEEMGIKVPLQEIGKFHYTATLNNGLIENEIDHVFIGTYNQDKIPFNPNEVETYEWQIVSELKKKIANSPQLYTPWLAKAFDLATKKLNEVKII